MPVTNDEIYAYLVDLSANIAQQFRSLESGIIEEFVNTDSYLMDLSANIALDFAQVNTKLDVINDELIFNTEQLSSVIVQGDFIQGQINDLSANLTAQNQVTYNLIVETFKDLEFIVIDETAQVLNSISDQTNDINTNTNTALSQYTNTINTNTNASVSSAVSILNRN